MTFNVSAKLLDSCILGFLNVKDTYGYDLTQQVGNIIDISESALYPVLRRLLKEGLLTTYDIPFEGRNRKYYKITPEGKYRLDFYRYEWEKHKNIIDSVLGGTEDE